MHIRLVQPTPLHPTALDRAVPFLDWTIWIYYSYAVFLLLPFAVCRDEEDAARACYRLMTNSMLAGLIFLVWPTSGVVQQPAVGGTSGLLWSVLLTVDRPTNYFPSLHIANTCICAFAVGRERGAWRPVALVWALLIIVSTVTTKQHFVIDLPGGAALAACSVWLVHRGVRVERPPRQW
jgi:membrane-associated phospholipid phosphatase